MPACYGQRTTIYNRFDAWRKAGVWDRLTDAIAEAYDGDVQMIDTSIVHVHQQRATAEKWVLDRCPGRFRGGLTTRLHALVGGQGWPIHIKLTAGQASDVASAQDLIGHLAPGSILPADIGYEANELRAAAAAGKAWVERRPLRRCRALATPAGRGLSRLAALGRRLGDPPPRRARIRPAAPKVPSARTIAHLMTTACDHLSKSGTVTMAAIEAGMPLQVEARSLINRFQAMIQTKAASDLDAWTKEASQSLVASLASGIMRNRAAVQAAIMEPWSNGQTEGQITNLKLVKRQIYGRGKLDLLQARLNGAA